MSRIPRTHPVVVLLAPIVGRGDHTPTVYPLLYGPPPERRRRLTLLSAADAVVRGDDVEVRVGGSPMMLTWADVGAMAVDYARRDAGVGPHDPPTEREVRRLLGSRIGGEQ